ncbi:hypothetical protein [Clavibacter tessellarius]
MARNAETAATAAESRTSQNAAVTVVGRAAERCSREVDDMDGLDL